MGIERTIEVPSTLTSGEAADASTMADLRTFVFGGASGDQVALECSNDGTNWRQLRVFYGPTDELTIQHRAKQYRATRLKGNSDDASLVVSAGEEIATGGMRETHVTVTFEDFADLANGTTTLRTQFGELIPEGATFAHAKFYGLTAFDDDGGGTVFARIENEDEDVICEAPNIDQAQSGDLGGLVPPFSFGHELAAGPLYLRITDDDGNDLNDMVAGSITAKVIYFVGI